MSEHSAEELLRREPAGGRPPADPDPAPVGFGQVFRWAVAAALGVLAVALGAYSLYLVRGALASVLMVLGVPYALPLAVAVAITDLIPLVGATIGAELVTAITFFTSDLWPATVVVALFFIVYQQVENYLLVPRVMRNTVDISAIAVLLSALVGATVLGVMGALMAIPVAAAVKVVLTPMIERHTEVPVPAPAQGPAPPGPGKAAGEAAGAP